MFFFFEWLGTILVILAYALNQFELLGSESMIYVGMNFVGACLLGIILWSKKVYGPFIIQIVWGSIALLAFIKYII